MIKGTEARKHRLRRIILVPALVIAACALVPCVLFSVTVTWSDSVFRGSIQNFKVTGKSMQPTFASGDYLIVNKLNRTPKRQDIIVFKYPKDERFLFVERVIGLPGERIRVENGQVYVNDIALDEPYVAERPKYALTQATIPDRAYFVLGDNRNSSLDSHNWGFVP